MVQSSLRAVVVLLAVALPFAAALAQTAPVVESEAVVVTGTRDPAIVPYKKAFELGTLVRSSSDDRVDLQVRLTSTRDDQPIPGLTVSVVGSKSYGQAAITPAGFFSIPLDREAYDDSADFIVNQKAGSVRMRVFLVPKLSGDRLTYADIVQTVQRARAARASILPWYLRLITPTVNGVGLCFDEPGHAIVVASSETTRRAADRVESDDAGTKVLCANFTATEADMAQTTTLSADRPFKPIFIESLF